MLNAVELLRQDRTEELWQMCCGFVDLSLKQFMSIQRRLLLEQMELLKKCELGNYIMNGARPNTVEEFREQVPLTTYADYAPYLLEKREDVLPEKPMFWMRCIGRSGEYKYKWVPVTEKAYREAGKLVFAAAVFATCKKRGDINITEHDRFLHALAPPPFATGMMAHMVDDVFHFAMVPSLDVADKMTFKEKTRYGFEMSLSEGLDLFGGLTSVLFNVGEQFSEEIRNSNNFLSLLSKPKTLQRLGKGWLKSKLARRPMLPKDVWSIKGLVGGGTDTSIYRERVKEMWGRYPLDIYGCTENVVIATQTWDYQGMTFNPFMSFLEFLPVDEYYRWKMEPDYKPGTLLLDEVKPGHRYLLIITSLNGGAFSRYVIGDMIRVTSLRNEQLNIDIPQIVVERRVDGLIDIAGFARLTEKIIWQAIDESGIPYEGWVARKESAEKPVLHIYMELKQNGHSDADQVAFVIHEQLRRLDSDYADLENMLGLKPLKVTLLPDGTFKEYTLGQRANGASSARIDPPRINPSEDILDALTGSV